VVPDLPADVAAVLDRCLQKRRDTRLDDLGPLVEVLGRYADPTAPGARTGGTMVNEMPPPTASTVTKAAVARTGVPAEGAKHGPARLSLLALGAGALLVIAAGAIVLRSRSGAPPVVPEATRATAAIFPSNGAPMVSAVEPGASATATAAAASAATGNAAPPSTPSGAPLPSARRAGRGSGAPSATSPEPRETAKPSLGGVIEKPPF
jgi:serine/threonine-protein kinase